VRTHPSASIAVPTTRVTLTAARGWNTSQTAARFLVESATIASWVGRVNEHGPDALLRTPAHHWLAANMMGEALLGFHAFNNRKLTGKDVIDFVEYRRRIVDGQLMNEALFEAVLPKPKQPATPPRPRPPPLRAAAKPRPASTSPPSRRSAPPRTGRRPG